MIKLFMNILTGELFHFGDRPDRHLVKLDGSHYVAPEGVRLCHPHVAVFPSPTKPRVGGMFDDKEGDSNGSGDHS